MAKLSLFTSLIYKIKYNKIIIFICKTFWRKINIFLLLLNFLELNWSSYGSLECFTERSVVFRLLLIMSNKCLCVHCWKCYYPNIDFIKMGLARWLQCCMASLSFRWYIVYSISLVSLQQDIFGTKKSVIYDLKLLRRHNRETRRKKYLINIKKESKNSFLKLMYKFLLWLFVIITKSTSFTTKQINYNVIIQCL